MAREKRQISPNGIYHILLRGVNELFSNDADFKKFIELLEYYFKDTDTKLLGYALMKNRVHMIIKEGEKGVSMIMKPICTSYARYFNRVHDLQGKLFYDRYKSEPINDDTALDGLKAFLNTVPADYKGGVDGFSELVGLNYIDDYCRMTDDELKSYIENIFKCEISAMTKKEKQDMAQEISDGKKIGAARIYKLFGLGRKVSAKKEKREEVSKTEENTTKRDSNLSVWLL